MGPKPVDGFAWEATPPKAYTIASGRFAETSPEPEGPKNRPLLITRVVRRKSDGLVLCRVFYGTTRNLHLVKPADLYVQSASALDQLNLACATRFILSDANQCIWLPWKYNHFEPWEDSTTPVRCVLPEAMQRYVAHSLGQLPALPNPPLKTNVQTLNQPQR